MTEFAVALLAFLAAHTIPAMPGLRARLVDSLGRRVYLTLYSLLSLALLGWVVVAARRADTILLWQAAPWQWHWALTLMPVAAFLLVAGLMAPNPLSISVRAGQEPGAIVGITRHPVLWGFLLWALAHIPPNGDLVSVILFGGMALFSVAGFFVLDARNRRRLPPARWAAFARETSVVPFAAALRGRARVRLTGLLIPALVAGVLYAWFLLQGHAWLIGPDPLAGMRAFQP